MTPCSARCVLALIVFFNFAAPAFPQTPAQGKTSSPAKKGAPERPEAALSERQRAIHALNRLTFGPRPGDVDAVLAKGVDGWIEDQLHPESIDDSALNARLGPFVTTRLNPKKLAETFPTDGVIRQFIAGKRSMPDDPAVKLVYSVHAARIQQQEAASAAAAKPGANANAAAMNAAGTAPATRTPQDQAREIAEKLLALPREQGDPRRETHKPRRGPRAYGRGHSSQRTPSQRGGGNPKGNAGSGSRAQDGFTSR